MREMTLGKHLCGKKTANEARRLIGTFFFFGCLCVCFETSNDINNLKNVFELSTWFNNI